MRVRKDGTGKWFVIDLDSNERGEIAHLSVRNGIMMDDMIAQVMQVGLAYIRSVEAAQATRAESAVAA
jgi:hypothetical protein